MKAIDKILVAIDADEEVSETDDGFPVELIKALCFVVNKSSTQLHLLSVGYEKYISSHFYDIGTDYSAMQKEYSDRMKARLGALSDKLTEQGYQVTTELVWAYPRYEQIVNKAIEFDAELVISHTRSYAKLERNHLTNDSWQLVRTCPKPLLLVKDKHWADHPVLMAAVDPVHSHHKPLGLDFEIIDAAIRAKSQLGGDLHILHAYSGSVRPFSTPEALHKEHNDAFRELVSDYNIAPENLHLVEEAPTFALQHHTEKLDIDIIAMGAISRSRLSDAMIGNTAERVLDYLKTDVLIVKPSSKA